MAPATFRLHLIRHGEVHNPQQILYGRLPRFRLSAKGRQQAASAGRHLKSDPVRALFSSPMLRARQTAGQIRQHNPHLDIHISGLINEVCTSYEGCPGDQIDAMDGDVYTGVAACFEQPRDIVARTRKFIRRMRVKYAGTSVAAVTHGDVVTFMALWAKGAPVLPKSKIRLPEAGFPVAYPAHASITTLTYQTDDPDERPAIAYWQPG